MSLSRRGLLNVFLAAPAIVLTPGLLMPIKASPPEVVVTGPGSTIATTSEIAARQRAAYGLVECAPGLSVPIHEVERAALPDYYHWLISSPDVRAEYWEEPPVPPESWDWSVIESSRALREERKHLREARLRARPSPITPAYINLINRSAEPIPKDYVPLRADLLEKLYSGRANPFHG